MALMMTLLTRSRGRCGACSCTASTFTNPVLWEDYPDLDVFRVGDVFYYSASSFAFSPGAPVLKSYDLVNWTPTTHSIPTLNFAAKYNLTDSQRAYVGGVWASSLRYRESTDTFYWIGCVEGESFVWAADNTGASKNNGEVTNWDWQPQSSLPRCYYDCGLFIDDDDTLYVAYGSTSIMVAQLNADGTAEVKNQEVYVSPDNAYIEGSRMYKINGNYYIFVTQPASAEWVLKASSPWGPYEKQILVDQISGPLANAGYSHQGGVVDTKDNKWYYVAFMDSYPGGRIPVVAPLTWDSSGWPSVVKNGTAWGNSYPVPVETDKKVPAPTGTDDFQGTSLSHHWEWNHNPDNTKWSIVGSSGGLRLDTSTVTHDLFSARNTLTRRVLGPKSSGTFKIHIGEMADGDRAGAVLFRDLGAYIGVHKAGAATTLFMANNLQLDSTNGWSTKSNGTVVATGPTISVNTTDIWLRINADVTPAFGLSEMRQATFWYSLDGDNFTELGPSFSLSNDWHFFSGYRFGVFNFATKALGGQVTVGSFTLAAI
ncbi:Arabinanase/levansucrase/invertase [Massarina eburnea CBS 473.64]|uniref:Arabinanase/levansucrase/invertase n=1 Tax=Massarina eburnea CBS 473.64 TaxID=1395130 RepID=A0A6A6SAY6_9PLEO|nr:Arabinanase/levansucrase/invertase [Massarina eburnea CBS 473.64]